MCQNWFLILDFNSQKRLRSFSVFTTSWHPASSRPLATDTQSQRYPSTLDIFPMKSAPRWFVNSTECNISSYSSDAGEVDSAKIAVAHLVS